MLNPFHPLCLRVILFVLASVLVNDQEWHSIPGGRWKDLVTEHSEKVGFILLDPRNTGFSFTNTLSEERAAINRTLFNGSGVATGDVNGDGLPEIAIVGVDNQLQLYRNLGGFKFTNVTESAGLDVTNSICRAVVLADITGDGALDLLLGTGGSGVQCWRNDGLGHFVNFTAEARTSTPFASYSLALADVDGNGTVDLYVANNRTDDMRDRGQVQLRSVRGQAVVPPSLTNRLVLVNGRLLEYGEPDILYLNDGEGHFHPVSWTGGAFRDEQGAPLAREPLDWGLTATFRDLNDDSFPDLYVCNDFWTPDRIWFNDGKGRFQAAPQLAFRKTSGSSMGVDMADLDGDGRPEIFALDMLSRSPAWRKRQMAAQPPASDLPGDFMSRPQVLRNTFFHARPDGTYEELANYAGLAASEWAWQPVFLDIDLDGQLDLLVTSGHAHDVQDRDAEAQVQARQRNYGAIADPRERKRVFSADLLANNQLYPRLETPIIAFRNEGDLRFEDVTESWGTAQPAVHHGISTADFDGDGDLDFVVNNLNSAASIYRNDAGRSRIAVRLAGKAPNRQAIGAVAILRRPGFADQRQEVVAGGRYLSGSDPLLVFGPGDAKDIKELSLEVRWRSGTHRIVKNLEASRLYEITEDSSIDTPFTPPQKALPAPWFSDVSAQLRHSHLEAFYDDLARQPLLPHRLSQLGPGVAWTDLDRDGWDDLLIGTGASGQIGAFRNDQHGGFNTWTNGPLLQLQPRDTTTLLSTPSGILAGAANYEDGRTNAACLFLFQPDSPGARAILRDFPSSIGPLALADLDGDGSLNLFVGSRVLAGRWPQAGSSLVFHPQGAIWLPIKPQPEGLATNQGVSGAVWSDLNGDGFPELILAGDFTAVQIFRNDRGKLSPWDPPIRASSALSSVTNLSALTGLWNSVNAGDFDNDGRLDLVFGNYGENGSEQASPAHPLVLLGLEGPGRSLSLIETTYDSHNRLTPSRSLDELASSLPFLNGRYSTHRQFSEAPLDELLPPNRTGIERFSANTLKSVLLLNRGEYFELNPLPREAQFAPVFGICVADFNLDGNEDLFLAQNFSPMRPGVPKLDAGRGLLLKGNGKGAFSPMDASESGFKIYGDQRGAAVADYDHDSRPDLVVTQNGAQTRLFHNETQRSGLRVILHGPPENPQAIGTILRIISAHGPGPAREIRSGSGYWSQDSAVTVLARPDHNAFEVEIRWPGGKTKRTAVAANATEIEIHSNPDY